MGYNKDDDVGRYLTNDDILARWTAYLLGFELGGLGFGFRHRTVWSFIISLLISKLTQVAWLVS